MAKKKKNDDVVDPQKLEETQIEITSATIKDDFCNYSFVIVKGLGAGDTHGVKGKGVIDDDLRRAFFNLNVHLACIDDVFKHAGEIVVSINDLRSHELATLYSVSGIKIRGNEDDLGVILVGNKFINVATGLMAIETPKIALDSNASYPYHKELKKAIEKVREEVILYKNGKYTPVESPEDDPTQLKITDEDLENAEV